MRIVGSRLHESVLDRQQEVVAMAIGSRDRSILRRLAGRVAEIADLPVMEERRQMWIRHNQLESVRPMVLVFPEGGLG